MPRTAPCAAFFKERPYLEKKLSQLNEELSSTTTDFRAMVESNHSNDAEVNEYVILSKELSDQVAVVMDLYSRPIIGWSMSHRHDRHFAVNALSMALAQRRPDDDLIHHSDRDVQYMSDDFQGLLKANGITCSMSGKGSCYDNAVVEIFFASMKKKRTRRRKYRTGNDARADVFDYIERVYNRKRRHGYAGNISPVLFEKRTLGLNSGVHQM